MRNEDEQRSERKGLASIRSQSPSVSLPFLRLVLREVIQVVTTARQAMYTVSASDPFVCVSCSRTAIDGNYWVRVFFKFKAAERERVTGRGSGSGRNTLVDVEKRVELINGKKIKTKPDAKAIGGAWWCRNRIYWLPLLLVVVVALLVVLLEVVMVLELPAPVDGFSNMLLSTTLRFVASL